MADIDAVFVAFSGACQKDFSRETTDCDCSYPKLEIYHKRQQNVTSQKLWRHIWYLCMFIV